MKSNNFRAIRFSMLAIVFVAYLPTLNAFYQQDEWIAFGNTLARGSFSLINLLTFSFAPNVGHYVPFHHIVFGLFFQLFGIKFFWWMMASIIWHLATTYVVGLLLFKLLKNAGTSALGMLLFGLSASAHQATTWVAADINTHGSTFFGLVSILIFLHSLDLGKTGKKWLYLSLVSIFISLLFKETTIGLFITLPIIYLIKDTSIGLLDFFRMTKSWIVAGSLYLFTRILMLFLPTAHEAASIVTSTQSVQEIIYNVVTFPSKAFSQSLFPTNVWLAVGKVIGRISPQRNGLALNTSQFEVFVQSQVLEVIFIAIFLSVVAFTYLNIRRNSTYYTRLSLFSLLFVAINSVIYAFSPERSGIITFIDSRNLYMVTFGSILFFLSLFHSISSRAINRIFVIVAILLLIVNVFYLEKSINDVVALSVTRRSILQRMNYVLPSSSKDIVIYVESDSSYFGLPGDKKTVPFQSGFGQTLLVFLNQKYHFPPVFYKNYFLWPISSEGYQNFEGVGYGYFENYKSLLKFVSSNNISINQVFSFRWQGSVEAIIDNSPQIRSMLEKDIKYEK